MTILLSITTIRLCIPNKFIIKCYEAYDIDQKDVVKVRQLSVQIEKKMNELKHIQSIVDKVLIKHTEDFTPPL